MRSFWAGLWVGLILIVLLVTYLSLTGYSLVNCRYEDSCHVEYENGAYRVIPGER